MVCKTSVIITFALCTVWLGKQWSGHPAMRALQGNSWCYNIHHLGSWYVWVSMEIMWQMPYGFCSSDSHAYSYEIITVLILILMIFAVLLCYLSSRERNAWKNSYLSGTQILTSVMLVQCSTSWVIKPAGSRSLCGSMISPLIEDTCDLINEMSYETL